MRKYDNQNVCKCMQKWTKIYIWSHTHVTSKKCQCDISVTDTLCTTALMPCNIAVNTRTAISENYKRTDKNLNEKKLLK